MSLQLYKLFHLLGILMIFSALGGIYFHASEGRGKDHPLRKFLFALHGVGMLLVLVAGFGMLARLQIMWPLPVWAVAKFCIWLVLGVIGSFAYRVPTAFRVLWFISLLLGAAAAYLAIWKPLSA